MHSAAIHRHGVAKGILRLYAPIVLITIVGLFLRAAAIGWNQFERDEAQCWAFATAPNLIDCIRNLSVDGNPPGIHVVLWFLIHLFGPTAIPAKLIALVSSASLPPLAFRLFRQSLGEFGTLQLCLLLALSPTLVRNTDLIRPYGLLCIFFLVSTAALLELLKGSRKQLVVYVATLTASLYLHLLSAILLAGHGLLVLHQLIGRKLAMSALKRWALGVCVILCLFSPWLYVVAQQLHQNLQPWNAHLTWDRFFIELHHALFFDIICGYSDTVPWFITTALVLGMLPYKGRGLRNEQWAIVFLGSVFAFFVLNQKFAMPFRLRYVCVLTPFAMLFISVFSARLYEIATKCGVMLGLVLFSIACLPAGCLIAYALPQLIVLHDIPESGVQILLHQVSPDINSSKDVVLVSPETTVPEVIRSLKDQQHTVPVVSFPRIDGPPYVEFTHLDSLLRDESRLPLLFQRLQKTLHQGGSVWFICTQPRSNYTEAELRRFNSFLALELLRTKQSYDWLETHARLDSQWQQTAREDSAHLYHFSALQGAVETKSK